MALPPPGLLFLALLLLIFLPGRWWRWKTRRFRRGVRHLRGGREEEARAELERFLESVEGDPRFPRVQPYFNLGRRYPYVAAAKSNLGVVALRKGRVGEALAWFRAALEAEPGWVPALYGEASVLYLREDLAGAERGARAVLERRPRHVAARLLLALTLRAAGREEDADAELASVAGRGADPEELLSRLRQEWTTPH